VRRLAIALGIALGTAVSPAAALGAGAMAKAAQHETSADVQDGARVFRSSCANCHGPDGDLIAGIDLGRGVFRREMSDGDLIRIIRTGIPNTPMPPTNMSEAQAAKVVAYLRSTAAMGRSTSAAGDPVRGKTLFDGKGRCASCHRVGVTGSRLGPELSAIGRVRRTVDLEQSLLDPPAEIQPTGRFYRVVTKDGVATTGRLLNLDTFTVQLMDQKEQLRSFMKTDLREHGWAPTPMPSYKGTLTTQEIADVVSYLVSLKGTVTR
jgi:putative heme-binding domain-containing protein